MLELHGLSLLNQNSSVQDTRHYLLREISYTFPDQCFIAITGPNGGGKTVLAQTIMGMHRPTSGSICFDGREISKLSIDSHARLGISFAFQQPARFTGLTVRELFDLASGRTLRRPQLENSLTQVGLKPDLYIDRFLDDKLSGGEVKRLEIAMVLLRKSKLIIFDEPEASVDLFAFSQILKLFRDFAIQRHFSTIVITHQKSLLQLADQIVVLESGQISRSGPANLILSELNLSQSWSACS